MPRPAQGHSSFRIGSYPVTKAQAIEKVGAWKVPLGDEKVPLGDLLARMPVEDFADPAEAVKLVDWHWARMVRSDEDAD